MAGFNEQQFRAEEQEIRSDLKKYGLHHDKQFMKAFDGYMTQLHKNGLWVQAQHTPNPAWAADAATNLIAEFDRTNALHVPAKWWRDNKRNKNFAAERDAKAQDTFNKKYLWSKTEPYYPAKKAAEAGGLILETSFPGKIFNGKNFGFENWSDAPVQAQLWEHMSSHYVDAARGPVEAVMLGGKVDGSVLTKHEWPHLKKRIEAGEVSNLHVKVMGFRNDSQESQAWSLETRATFNVHSQNSFDQIPSPQDPDFWDKQNRWRNQEKARNASKSSASSSSSQDSAASNFSLKSFHKAFDDPSAVVVLADPGAPSTQRAESPGEEQLSRVVTRQMSVADTTATRPPLTRQQTIDAVRTELQAQAAAVHSLDEKLSALREQQVLRAAGTPAWPGAQNYEAGLNQGMSSMAPFRAPTLDYSPTASAPGASESYFPQGLRYTANPVTTPSYSYTPQAMGSTLPQSESPLQTGSFEYPPAPVHGAQTFSPYTNTQERTPSTGSASSDFGAPLQPTQRHPSPPSEAPAPVASSASGGHGHSSSKKSKKTKEPSSTLMWLAGKKQGGPSKK
ncbi:hypothetical protein [Streptomyces sp. NPDC005244]|uniref:hypothetical protein n=1 Tax=Streptomyces sp. NPDC005244 TaxID=3364708 RepID=UPI00369AE2BA